MRRQTRKFKAMKLARDFWRLACTADGIPADSSFVIFSNDNKYYMLYSRAMKVMYNNM